MLNLLQHSPRAYYDTAAGMFKNNYLIKVIFR